MASNIPNLTKGCFPTAQGALEHITEKTVYQYETVIGQANDKVNIHGGNVYLFLDNNVQEFKELLKNHPKEVIRIVQRTRQSIQHHADDDENPPEEHFEDQTKENEMAQEDDIIKVLEDASDNPNIEAELQVIEDESDNVQGGKVSVKLTITKTSTIMEPFCRLNKVVFLILAFLLVATSIFILFLVYVFKGIG